MITEEAIIDLLPVFVLCKNYDDRLAFWENHELTERLYYDIPSAFEFWYPISPFTIAPFTKDEARQFVDWALRVRPVMHDAPLSAQKLCLDFENRYYSIERKADRQEYLQECQNNIDLLVKDKNWSSIAQRSMILDELRLSPTLYAQFFARLRGPGPFKPNLIDYIRVGDNELDWEIIDTYLYTSALFNYAKFLDSFIPIDFTPANVNDGTIDNKQRRKDNENTQRIARQAATLFEHRVQEIVIAERGKNTPKKLDEIVKAAILKYCELAANRNFGATEKSLNRYLADIGKSQTAKEYGRQLVRQLKLHK